MGIVFFDGECFDFDEKLEANGDILPVSSASKARLCDKLGKEGWTYLTIKSPTGSEIVKVRCVDGDPVITRAQGGTTAKVFSADRCACFVVNKPVLDDWFDEAKFGGCKPKVVSGDDIIEVETSDNGCTFTVKIDADYAECINTICNDDPCHPCVLPDGVYENATVTIIDGKVCGVANGTNIVYTGSSCCGCGDAS